MKDSLCQNELVNKLQAFEKIFIGFSGGLDSMVLLNLLASHPDIHSKLSAIHVNHGLSPYADEWEVFCKIQAQQLGIQFQSHQVRLNSCSNIESKARTLRYDVFESYINTDQDALVLAHHKNDQAETLLLNLFRGSGLKGLSAMTETSSFGGGELIRPLLSYSRDEVYEYALSHQLSWIDDESNNDTCFSRNFIRHDLLPLIQKKWPAVVNNIVRTSILCQMAEAQMTEQAKEDVDDGCLQSRVLSLSLLKKLDENRINYALRYWFEINKVQMPDKKHLEVLKREVIFAREDSTPNFTLGDMTIKRFQDKLYLLNDNVNVHFTDISWNDFPNDIVLNGLGTLHAKPSDKGFRENSGTSIKVGFRKGGEHFKLNGHTKNLKKWMQEWSIPPWKRGHIPLIIVDGELAVVCGYAISDLFYDKNCGYQFELTDTMPTKNC